MIKHSHKNKVGKRQDMITKNSQNSKVGIRANIEHSNNINELNININKGRDIKVDNTNNISSNTEKQLIKMSSFLTILLFFY